MARFSVRSIKQLKSVAGYLLKKLLLQPGNGAAVLAFSGELGAGKTALLQNLAKTLGVRGKVQSPTFVLMKKYRIPKNKKIHWETLFHIDAYRLTRKRETAFLDLPTIFHDSRNIVAIEWAEKLRRALPSKTLWVELRHKGKTHRHVIIK